LDGICYGFITADLMFNNDLTCILSTGTHFDLVSEIERIPAERFAL
jgi:hypothetical protein